MSGLPDDLAGLSPKRLALLCLELQAQIDGMRQARPEPIAIIGIGCRLPGGASTPEEFWRLLREGVDAVREVPAGRWDAQTYYDPDPAVAGKMYTRSGGFLEPIDQFDPEFFGISPREARSMDPQQRLLLEVSWEALEHAGQPTDRLAGTRTGVFVGIGIDDYAKLQLKTLPASAIDAYTGTGNAFCFAAGRLSYLLGTHGPSIAMDTACSTSLVTIHLACMSLRAGECSLALAGGVSLMLAPEPSIFLSKAQALSPDGRCKTFDASADGYGRGEGCGMLVLKRLSDAVADGDNVLAVIRGSAINHDGQSSGLTVPNGMAQQDVIRAALAQAGVEPNEVSYVEAHGTGTALGDPIEVRSLAAVMGQGRAADRPLWLGSVKTNIGHLEVAAGVASVIKVALALQHRTIPPHLHYHRANPHLSLEAIPARIPTACVDWPAQGNARIAGVSSFGLSGTNVHLVLEEAPAQPRKSESERSVAAGGPHLLALSARDPWSLGALAGAYQAALAPGGTLSDTSLHDICAAAGLRRTHHTHRWAAVVTSSDEARQQLAMLARETAKDTKVQRQRKLAFVFSGQGPQWWAMGRELMRQEPTFLASLEECDAIFRRYGGLSILDELQRDEASSRLAQTEIAQPALFALQVALARQWESWGIRPDAVVGHSLGEVAAAYVGGALTLEDAARLTLHRGRVMQRATGQGRMAAVELPLPAAEQIVAASAGKLSVAALNSPTSTVLSGDAAALRNALAQLEARGVQQHILGVDYAFHSYQMQPLEADLVQGLKGLIARAAALPIYSTVTGRECDGASFDAAYWGRNLTQPVCLAPAVRELIAAGHDVFLEIGPHPVLGLAVTQCLEHAGREGSVLYSLRRHKAERGTLLHTLGRLYTMGFAPEWRSLYPGGARVVRLPIYPWHRRRCWIDAPGADGGAQPKPERPLQARRVRSPAFDGVAWDVRLRAEAGSFLADHRIHDMLLLPATAYLELALSAGGGTLGAGALMLEDVAFQEPLVLDPEEEREVQTLVRPTGAGAATFQIYSLRSSAADEHADWILHAAGSVRLVPDDAGAAASASSVSLPDLAARYTAELAADDFYQRLRARGFQFGPGFRGIRKLWQAPGAAFGRIELPEPWRTGAEAYRIHPALLDACIHLLAAALPEQEQTAGEHGYLPVGLRRLRLYCSPGTEVWCEASLASAPEADADSVSGDLRVYDAGGNLVAELDGLWLRRVTADLLPGRSRSLLRGLMYDLRWHAVETALPTAKPRAAGVWLLFADRGNVARSLAEALRARGEACVVATPAAGRSPPQGYEWSVDPASAASHAALLERFRAVHRPCHGIVYLAGLDATLDGEAIDVNAQDFGCRGLLHLTHALGAGGWTARPRLWVVTRGSQSVAAGGEPVAVAEAPLWGMTRVLALEKPDLSCVGVDLDPHPDSEEIRHLIHELDALPDENQVAWRSARRYLPRIHRRAVASVKTLALPAGESFQLQSAQRGVLDRLVLSSVARRPPGAGEVEIRVHATGLNFKDVLSALGMYPGDAGPLGSECAGVVVTVGTGVSRLREGDAVIAFAPGSFSRYVTTSASFVVRKPARIGFEEGATLPIAFVTANYALTHLARLRAGERVLLHAAAGGVGLAAIQIAQRAGAEIFATAGSAHKRRFLRSLGVQHVMDSRSLAFADEVRRITRGGGVDVVLNSLAGEFIRTSLSLLSTGGRFVEIGKIDILDHAQAAALRPDVSYHVVALDQLAAENSPVIGGMLQELHQAFEENVLQPLPRRVFPMDQVVEAFRYMAQARHIGKLVVSQAPLRAPAGLLSPDATYLVTGGLGALGLSLARWMIEQGARRLVLMGRGAGSEQAQQTVRELRRQGARVAVEQGDVARREDVARVLAQIEASMPPLKGVVHAAGILEDGVLEQQPWDRFAAVFPAKVQGAWNLHKLTERASLDFFVLFSSVACVFGSPGQGNYAAANAFLDALAHHRRALGQPALAVDWGPWSEAGFAAGVGQRGQQRWATQGVGALRTEQGLAALGHLLGDDATRAIALAVEWPAFIRQFPRGERTPLFAEMAAEAARRGTVSHAGEHADLLRRLQDARPAEAHELLRDFLRGQVAQLLGFDTEHPLDTGQGLLEMGMDSLMAVDLRNRLFAAIGQSLSPTVVFDYPTIDALTGYLAREVLHLEDPARAASSGDEGELAAVLERLEQLSEEEARAVLAARLEQKAVG